MAKRSGKRGTRAPRHARGALSSSKGGAASSAEVGDSSRAGRIVEAAMALFEEHGYSATTVDDIASRAGVAKGSVYWHFKSKEGLLLAIVDMAVGGVMADAAGSASAEQERRRRPATFGSAPTPTRDHQSTR